MFRIPKEEHSLLTFGQSTEPALAPEELSLLVWNVWKGKRGSPWEKDFQRLRDHRDIILLQEAVADDRMSQVFQACPRGQEWHMATSFAWSFSPHPTGVITGSSAAVSDRRLLRGKERELFFLTPKVSLSTLYALQGRDDSLLVINTHVVNFTTTASFIRFVEELVGMLEAHKGPVVLAGDFNTWSLRRWQSLVGILDRLNLKHVDVGEDPRFVKLDHVFVRGLKVKQARVKNTVTSSDHFPLLVDLSVT